MVGLQVVSWSFREVQLNLFAYQLGCEVVVVVHVELQSLQGVAI